MKESQRRWLSLDSPWSLTARLPFGQRRPVVSLVRQAPPPSQPVQLPGPLKPVSTRLGAFAGGMNREEVLMELTPSCVGIDVAKAKRDVALSPTEPIVPVDNTEAGL